jgi:hypothetical protein
MSSAFSGVYIKHKLILFLYQLLSLVVRPKPYIPEDITLHKSRGENLKFYILRILNVSTYLCFVIILFHFLLLAYFSILKK